MNHTSVAPFQYSLRSVPRVGAYEGPLLDLLENYSSLPGWDVSCDPEGEAVEAGRGKTGRSLGDPGYRWRGRYGWMGPDWGRPGSECGGACVEKREDDGTMVFPLMCGKWSCPVCGYRRWMWFYRNLSEAIKRDGLVYFWTLTIDTKTMTAAESYVAIKKAWNQFRGSVKRKHYGLKFVWVLESTQNGYAHLHVLMNTYLEHGWVKEAWKHASKGSYVVWVRKVDNAGAAGYMSKYLCDSEKRAADALAGDALAGQHRFGRSKSVEFDPFHKPARGWEIVHVSFKERLNQALSWSRVLRGSWVGTPGFLEEPYKGGWLHEPADWAGENIGLDMIEVMGGSWRDGS